MQRQPFEHLTLRIPADIKRRLDAEAERRARVTPGFSRSDVVRELLVAWADSANVETQAGR